MVVRLMMRGRWGATPPPHLPRSCEVLRPVPLTEGQCAIPPVVAVREHRHQTGECGGAGGGEALLAVAVLGLFAGAECGGAPVGGVPSAGVAGAVVVAVGPVHSAGAEVVGAAGGAAVVAVGGADDGGHGSCLSLRVYPQYRA